MAGVREQTLRALDVLFQDEHYVVVNKPSGLIVHRNRHVKCDEAALQVVRDQLGGSFVYPVHRLDRGTSGTLVLALSSEAASRLCESFRENQVHKTYVAVVRGYLEEEGCIDYELANLEGQEKRPAVTRFRSLSTVELPLAVGRYNSARYSLVEVRPETGRYHQIRRHFHHIFHPVIGDATHGDGRHNRLFREQFGIHRLLLMAVGLTFRHPYTGVNVSIGMAPEEELVRVFPDFMPDQSTFASTVKLGNSQPRKP
jgi:tRNA pseudouridine65 synthase